MNAQMTHESLGEIHTALDHGINLVFLGHLLYLFVIPDTVDLLKVTMWPSH